jgi:hypothetical protein
VDVLAAPGRRPPQVTLHQRPSVAPDRGREEVTSHRSLAGPQQQQQQLAAERVVFRMDTVVRLEPGVLLQNLTKANAAKVKRLRWSVQEEEWFPVT